MSSVAFFAFLSCTEKGLDPFLGSPLFGKFGYHSVTEDGMASDLAKGLTLSLHAEKCSCFCRMLIFFQNQSFHTQNSYNKSANHFRSRSGTAKCRALSGSKLMSMVIIHATRR